MTLSCHLFQKILFPLETFYLFWLISCSCSIIQLCLTLATLWTVAHQAHLSKGFPRKEYWSRLPFPLPRDLSDSGIEPMPLTSPALAGRFFIPSATWETPQGHYSWPFQIYSLMYSITNKTQLLFHQNCAVFLITILCIFC